MELSLEASAAADASRRDDMLARCIAAGDKDAWGLFFDRYSTWAFRFAYRHLGGNHADAEDLCSEIMLTAAKSAGKFDHRRGDLDSWMYGIARHCVSRFCRGRKINQPIDIDIPDPGSPTDRSHTKDIVNRALAGLPERQASALIAMYVQGYTTDEIARGIGTTPKAAESLLVRARVAFRLAFNSLLADTSAGGGSRK
jgi:RNA polymerase sigma-70 factor (ECF subfamily)